MYNRQLSKYVFDYQQSKKLLLKKSCHVRIGKKFYGKEVDKNMAGFPVLLIYL